MNETRKRPAKRTRKMTLKGWVVGKSFDHEGMLMVYKDGPFLRLPIHYRATLTIEVPAK